MVPLVLICFKKTIPFEVRTTVNQKWAKTTFAIVVLCVYKFKHFFENIHSLNTQTCIRRTIFSALEFENLSMYHLDG